MPKIARVPKAQRLTFDDDAPAGASCVEPQGVQGFGGLKGLSGRGFGLIGFRVYNVNS